MSNPPFSILGLIAGSGVYPLLMARGARAAGVQRIVAAAFEGETDPALADCVDEIEWTMMGKLGKLVKIFASRGIRHAVMAGQVAPSHLFNLRPDLKALIALARLKERNAESLFGAVADELGKAGVEIISATSFMDEHLACSGVFAGPRLSSREEEDIAFGFQIAKEISRLDIGQTVVVKKGTVLAVEGFDGTNATIRRGGALGKGKSTVVKVSKPNQDFRFDVPVIGPTTLEIAAESYIRTIAVEAGRLLVLDRERVNELAKRHGITLFGIDATAA